MSQDDQSEHPQILRGNAAFAAFQPDASVVAAPRLELVEQERTPGSIYEPPARQRSWKRSALMIAALGVLGAIVGFGGSPELRQWLRDGAEQLPGAAQVAFVEETVVIDVVVRPIGTRLFIDGEPVASNPIRVRKDGRLHRLMGLADGYKPAEVVFSPDTDQQLSLKLRKRAPR